ncbi:uncharacterized protein [Palaemon carinicauda]|uniref:uncharacterized protein n=1 Tax=Palaemon carinicauda TaxID=392227 RepID=UPI0035B665BD
MAETLWCFIGCFFFGSYLILFAGLGLLIGSGSLRGGFALVFLGGILAATSTFVTCTAYWFRFKRVVRNVEESEEDMPPSYRNSWERAFLGRTFTRNQRSNRHQGTSTTERPDARMNYRTQHPPTYTNFAMSTNDESPGVPALSRAHNQYQEAAPIMCHLNPKFLEAPPSYDEAMAMKDNS